ncbi:TAT-binding protein-like protein 7, AAA ATPase [Diatrype stigma]|uniref:TAT-binding protein-like protein 7, AAA ATPase n=1 Tax=Diatrype stigma TaxID=117547 RepID=A0AAN9U6I4_9PEZI
MAKRKRGDALAPFDPNMSDPEDETFDIKAASPPHSRKKPRSGRDHRPSARRRNKYKGSDLDDDDDVLEDSEDEGSFDDGQDDDEEDEPPISEHTGRRIRKAAAKAVTYRESSNEEDDPLQETEDQEQSDGPKKVPQRSKSKIIKLKIPPGNNPPVATRRTTRARTADAEETFVELTNSGRHAKVARASKSKSPETLVRSTRTTRGGKAPKKSMPPVEEATQESSIIDKDVGQSDGTKEDPVKPADDEGLDADAEDGDQDVVMDTVEPNEQPEEDDDDDGPITRRTRGARTNIAEPAADVVPEPEANPAPNRRLTRRSNVRKPAHEQSSDFEPEPDNESADGNHNMSDDDGGHEDGGDWIPISRGKKSSNRKRKSKRGSQETDDSGDELDKDELAEEALDLREASESRARPRRRRRSPELLSQDLPSKRARNPVNYALQPLNQFNIEEEIEDAPAPTSSRRRGARAVGGWERSLHTVAGPFGGISDGAGAAFTGPWGSGAAEAAGGADSDDSDEEMGQRSNITGAGNIGTNQTQGLAAGGPAAPGQPLNLEALGGTGSAALNVGRIKNQKALADADPLGVDLSVDFSQVGGMQSHIEQLKEMVQLPLLYPDMYTRFHVTPPRGVLFHGPPGTGKTLLARALSNSIGLNGRKIAFYMRKGADALSKWVGEAERQLRLLFEEARRTQPSIIFFDEIDGLAPVRSSKQEQIHASIVSTLLALMDGMDGRGQVIVIGATNRPDNIDPALRRPGRFDREFYFPLPDAGARKAILDIHTKDWGLPDQFRMALARETKGYGGADLRALCTEAALNSIQRTYPQIYSSQEKLVVDPSKVVVHLTDFSKAKKKLVPSSQRQGGSEAYPLPASIEPLLRDQLQAMKVALDSTFPRKKTPTALEDAMFEPYDDDDFGFAREALQEDLERSRVFRPRFCITGSPGMGQGYLSAAIMHYFEGVHVQIFDLPTLLGTGQTVEQALVSQFAEVKRHKPSVIFIPNVDTWYPTLAGPALTAFLSMLRSIQPNDPVLLLATAETESKHLDNDLKRDLFGYSDRSIIDIARPVKENRQEYFKAVIEHIRRFPKDFPDPANRKKRVLEELPVAPPPPPKELTEQEIKEQGLRYRQLLNHMKVHLQPIMDQINRKYKKFRSPAIPQTAYQYLLDEVDPNYVRPDIAGAVPRPYEPDKDKDGDPGLRDTATGKFFYNLDIQSIEERLANGYYIKPKAFLKDVHTLKHDATALGDRERYLKASELFSNVEVDIEDIDMKFRQVDWDDEYRKEQARREQKAERARKKKAMQAIADSVQSDVSHREGQSQGDGQRPQGSATTTAHFQLIGATANASAQDSDQHPSTNGVSVPSRAADEDAPMDNAGMQPPSQWPPIEAGSVHTSTRATIGGNTTQISQFSQISQVSAIQSLPPGVSPSALINDASTTKTSDPSNRSSNFTQLTNGTHHEPPSSPADGIPDTQLLTQPLTQPPPSGSQNTSSEEQWIHSQAHGLARGYAQSGFSQSSYSSSGPKSHIPSMTNLLNDPSPDDESHRQSISSGSALVEFDEGAASSFLEELTKRTSGCTIEQLQQINREIMAEIWRSRHENNRMKVYRSVTRVFNEAISDIESMQQMMILSQELR